MACNCNIYNRKISGKMIFLSNPETVVFIPNHSCNTIADSTIFNTRRFKDFVRELECNETELLSKFQNHKSFECILSIEKLRKLGFLSYLHNRGGLGVVRIY